MDPSERIITLVAIIIGSIVGIIVGCFQKRKEKPETISSEGEILPCPKCSNREIIRIKFTWWGGILGPKLFHYVRCAKCGTSYNGKKGASGQFGITVFVTISIILGFLLFFLLFKEIFTRY